MQIQPEQHSLNITQAKTALQHEQTTRQAIWAVGRAGFHFPLHQDAPGMVIHQRKTIRDSNSRRHPLDREAAQRSKSTSWILIATAEPAPDPRRL